MKPKRVTKTYIQQNTGNPDTVFSLLCPVREGDWLEDWEYKLIYSESGLAEKGCIFSTPFNKTSDTIWYITEHDPILYKIEFVRITPNELVIKINIHLEDNYDGTTTSVISYEYTALNEKQNEWIEKNCDDYFLNMMIGWEKSINHYINSGNKLLLNKQ